MTSISVPQPVLADRLPRTLVRDAALVVGLAALTALLAQVRVPIPFSPVPVTGQTLAVLLGAAALGPLRSMLGMLLYVAVGVAGLPVFTQWGYGLGTLFDITGGYLLGFLLASLLVGAMARRGFDRRPLGTAAAFAAGSLVIYTVAVPWWMTVTGEPFGAVLWQAAGVFVVGDALKALIAAGLLPAAWRLANR
ncbi:biotin transporter BioY [Egibacter rhizosphaerae]|uniref:Biotin transporter n=1 Tax=Egibacter rhizosphaerae TaxID=1670831 RepID=A0A411YE23_9ACTN|nr:biotin transporter BioY [Egibacter rhizosphaerae]QBI19420.1 biotin transporter BioY [Egibacter rhizosphaerae]